MDISTSSITQLQSQIITCRLCPRLVDWRESVAREKIKRFQGDEYWGKPIPGFGDPKARLLLVGLAPAAHGGNRTGRMFTGDNSGNWLFRALYRAGFANQAESLHTKDGLKLTDCYITATLRCAPPLNKPERSEIHNCRSYLLQEIELLRNVRVVVGLGKIGFEAALNAYRESGKIEFSEGVHTDKAKPKFAHCAVYEFVQRTPYGDGVTFIASFHPSQQNTFTGRLTEAMLDSVFTLARRHLI